MDAEFTDELLKRLYEDPKFSGGFSDAVVKAFRKRMQTILAAADERDFYALKSLHCEQLKGKLHGQHSIRLNDQYRLLLRISASGGKKKVVIVAIVDYH